MSLQLLEHSDEILPLVGQDFGECLSSVLLGVSQNHFTHGVDAIAFKEHVLGAAQANANSTESDGMGSLLRRVGIGAHAEPRDLRAPVHQLLEILIRLALIRFE